MGGLCAPAFGQTPRPSSTPYTGGDQQPLTWYSSVQLDHPGTVGQPTQYTYERGVKNHSKIEVTDIHWLIAGYFRKIIPPGIALPDRVSVPGDIQIPPPKGELYYGPGRTAYLTPAIYAPKDGWKSGTAIRSVSRNCTAELQVAIREGERYKVCTVQLASSVTTTASASQFTYHVANLGSVPIRVFWSIPGSDTFRQQFDQTEGKPLALAGERSIDGTVTLSQSPAFYLSTVSISSIDRELLGRGVVAVLAGADAKRAKPLEEEWRE